MVDDGLNCDLPRLRPPLPPGEHLIERPYRSEASRRRRRYSAKDAGRIAKRAACDDGLRKTACAVMSGLDLVDDATRARLLTNDLRRSINELVGDPQGSAWDAFVQATLAVLAELVLKLRRGIDRSRLLRWVLRRLLIYNALIELLGYVAEMLVVVERAAAVVQQADELLELLACEGENDGNLGAEAEGAAGTEGADGA